MAIRDEMNETNTIDPREMTPEDAMGRCLMMVSDSYGLCPVCIAQAFFEAFTNQLAGGRLKHSDDESHGHNGHSH